jgi:hypothetical protein
MACYYHYYPIVLEALIKAIRYKNETSGIIIIKANARLTTLADGVLDGVLMYKEKQRIN